MSAAACRSPWRPKKAKAVTFGVRCRDALSINTVAASDSWVALPQAYVNSYLDTVTFPCALRLRSAAHPGRDWLVSWQGATAGSASTLDMPAALASAAGLRQGDPVAFELVPDLPEATVVYVEAATPADWSVIEAEAELLTEAILQQMKAVREGDTVPVWIRGRSSVAVRVLSAAPAATGVLLANESIVTVKPPDRDAEPSLAAQAEGAGDGKAAASDDSGSESDCSAAAPAKPNAKSAAGALSISDLTQRRLTSPLRLRVQVRAGTSVRVLPSISAGHADLFEPMHQPCSRPCRSGATSASTCHSSWATGCTRRRSLREPL